MLLNSEKTWKPIYLTLHTINWHFVSLSDFCRKGLIKALMMMMMMMKAKIHRHKICITPRWIRSFKAGHTSSSVVVQRRIHCGIFANATSGAWTEVSDGVTVVVYRVSCCTGRHFISQWKTSPAESVFLANSSFLSLSYARSILYAKTFIPQPLFYPLLDNPFTIVLHKRLSAYLFRAAHIPACWIGTKRNKDFHLATPQPIGNQDYWPNPSRMWI